MTAEAEARTLLIDIAGPVRLGENVKAALCRVALRTGLRERRVRGIWHGEVKALRANELRALLRAAREARELEAALHDRRTLLDRITACEAALGLRSAHEDGPTSHAVGRRAGAPDRSMAPGE